MMCAHSPILIRLIAQWPGEYEDEFSLHARFRDQRHHNEWFAVVGPVLEFIGEIRGRGVEVVPDWNALRFYDISERKVRASAIRSAKARRRWADPEYRRDVAMRREYRLEVQRAREAVQAGDPPLSGQDLERMWLDVKSRFANDARDAGAAA